VWGAALARPKMAAEAARTEVMATILTDWMIKI
jgi:hypothetical protein